ncbi:MAG: hypothetical protein ABIJ61_14585 [bacterium]
MSLSTRDREHSADLSASFLAAAGSAALLSAARVSPALWFISLFALVPFLWRLCHVSLRGAAILGAMLATFFVCATGMSDLVLAPQTFLFKLLALNAAFAVFAVTVNRVRKAFGDDPLLIALLWFPIEYALIHYAHLGTMFPISSSGSSLMIWFCSLFGILLGSLVIILSNSLLLLILRYVGRWMLHHKVPPRESENVRHCVFEEEVRERHWCCFPDVRAPPF